MVWYAELTSVKVYFDGGFHHAREGVGPWADLGYAIYAEDARSKSEYLTAASVGSELGTAVGYWDEDLHQLASRLREPLRSHPASHGPQVYDLVAAHGALLHLRTNHFHGKAKMLTDGKEVIDYVNGRDDAFSLTIDGEDVAGIIRAKIRALGTEIGDLTWERVRSEDNWADPTYKGLRRERHDLYRARRVQRR